MDMRCGIGLHTMTVRLPRGFSMGALGGSTGAEARVLKKPRSDARPPPVVSSGVRSASKLSSSSPATSSSSTSSPAECELLGAALGIGEAARMCPPVPLSSP